MSVADMAAAAGAGTVERDFGYVGNGGPAQGRGADGDNRASVGSPRGVEAGSDARNAPPSPLLMRRLTTRRGSEGSEPGRSLTNLNSGNNSSGNGNGGGRVRERRLSTLLAGGFSAGPTSPNYKAE